MFEFEQFNCNRSLPLSSSHKSYLRLDLRLIPDEVEALTLTCGEWTSADSLRVDLAVAYAELEG